MPRLIYGIPHPVLTSSLFCFEIPNPDLQLRQIQDPEKPIGDPIYGFSAWKFALLQRYDVKDAFVREESKFRQLR